MTKYRNPLVTSSGVPKLPINDMKATHDALYTHNQPPQLINRKTNASNRYLTGRGWR